MENLKINSSKTNTNRHNGFINYINNNNIYYKKGIQLIKLDKDKHFNLLSILSHNWIDIWTTYKNIINNAKKNEDRHSNEVGRLVSKVLSGYGLKDKIHLIELDELDWKDLIAELGGKKKKDVNGNWIMVGEYVVSTNNPNAPFVKIIKKK